MVIRTPGNRKTAKCVARRCIGISNRRRLFATAGSNVVNAGKTGRILCGIDARRVGDTGAQTEGSELVKGVDDAFAVMVEIHAKARPDRSLFIRSVDNSETGCEIGFLLRPKPGSVIGRPTGTELESRFVHLAMERGRVPLLVPRIRIDRRRDLLSVLLVGSLENGVPYAERDGKIRSRSPRILDVPFKFVCLELPIDEGTIGKQAPRCPALVHRVVRNTGSFGDPPNNVPISNFIGIFEATRDRLGSQSGWIGEAS